MPYEDEIPPDGQYVTPPAELEVLVHKVIGAAIEVHRELGPGMPEIAYANALEIEFNLRHIPYEREKPVDIVYKGVVVAKGRIDFLVDQKLVVDTKSIAAITAVDTLQMIKYIRIMRQPLGLILNFNVPVMRLGIKRVIETDFVSS